MTTEYVEPDEEMITITMKEYDRPIEDSESLNCLRSCGVDNWNGYFDAYKRMDEEDSEDDE